MDGYAAPMKGYQLFGLQLVEHARHQQTAVAQLIGQARHEDAQLLGAGGIDHAVEQEAHEALAQRPWGLAPLQHGAFLGHGGEDVEQVETDDEEVVEQAEHLVLRQGDEMAGADGLAGARKLGAGSKQGFGLQQPGGMHLFQQAIAAVGAAGGELHAATDQEVERAAGLALLHHLLSGLLFHKAKLGVARHLEQLIAAQPLEELEAQQLVVKLKVLH